MLESVNELIEAHAGAGWLLPALFVYFAVDGVIPPLPSEGVLIALAAIGASTGAPHWLGLLLTAWAGAWVGDNLAYLVGRRTGLDRFLRRRERGRRTMDWAARGFGSRGALIVVVGRWIPIGRAAVNLMAGATGYSQPRFAAWTVLSAGLWAAWSIALGTLAGSWVEDNALLAGALGAGLALVVAFVVERVSRRFAHA
ncbi:DedA family protein [Knoellia sp. CPCC 206450]|uniref:DedA family protein n=1 Tax=Knoellia tibetensis TaxID=3404798 RepID=UPI003B435787